MWRIVRGGVGVDDNDARWKFGEKECDIAKLQNFFVMSSPAGR